MGFIFWIIAVILVIAGIFQLFKGETLWGVVLIIFWILAVILVIAGIFQLFKGETLWGIVLIIVGFAVGPGGYSIFN